MTQTPPRSPMEQQGEILQDLARTLLGSLELPGTWAAVTAAFLPHGAQWAGRILITDRDGATSGGDAVFASDSAVTALLDALQEVTAAQSEAVISCRVEATRSGEEPDRIALGSTLNYDRDPGSFDGLGGVDADYARALAERVGPDRLPAWVRALLEGS